MPQTVTKRYAKKILKAVDDRSYAVTRAAEEDVAILKRLHSLLEDFMADRVNELESQVDTALKGAQ